jgi:8-oxo-dGTP diphosphatase
VTPSVQSGGDPGHDDQPEPDFVGAKLALILDGRVLVYLRDDFAGLPFAGHWDLPGGGRDGAETAEACVLRELEEEFGLRLGPERLIWQRVFPSWHRAGGSAVFFGGRIAAEEVAAIRFGSEGQRWEMMETAAFLGHPLAVPYLRDRLGEMLAARA